MWSLCQRKFSHSYSTVISQRYPTLHCQQWWLLFDSHFRWLIEVWVQSEHPYKPLSLSVPQSLSLSCASLKCSHLVCIWGCDPQNLSLTSTVSGYAFHHPSIHISCRLHLWILVYSMHIQSLWLARLTAKTGFPHNFQNQIPWHSMTFPWPLLHFFHACLSNSYTCKLVTVLLKIADVALMGSNSAKLAPCVVVVSHLKTKPTLLSISTSYLHCQI